MWDICIDEHNSSTEKISPFYDAPVSYPAIQKVCTPDTFGRVFPTQQEILWPAILLFHQKETTVFSMQEMDPQQVFGTDTFTDCENMRLLFWKVLNHVNNIRTSNVGIFSPIEYIVQRL